MMAAGAVGTVWPFDANAAVSHAELTLLATLTATPTTALVDFISG
jgi:hypothetical protein